MIPAPSAPVPDEISGLLMRGFYSMAFQPIRESRTARKVGFEALLRGPEGTPLASPGALFQKGSALPAELLHELDLACIGAALRTGRMLPGHTRLFINVHGQTLFRSGRNAADLMGLMDLLGVAPDRVVLEISETAEESSIQNITRILKPFRAKGVQIALDDVGVRYPWLYHILHLEPEYFKVDRAFVTGLQRNPRKGDLLSGLLDLGKRMGSTLIAEGIETKEEWRRISDLGVPLGQGFWLGTPRPAQDWTEKTKEDRVLGAAVAAVYGDAEAESGPEPP